MSYQPLKVTFLVAGGWVPPALPLHLDALLAYSVTQRNLDDIAGTPTVEALRALGEELPLERHEDGGDWVWKASAITPAVPVMNDSGFFTQRQDRLGYVLAVERGQVQHAKYQAGTPLKPYQYKIDTMRGVHRNMLGFFPVQRPMEGGLLTLEAWCVGNHDLLEEILTDDRRPTHIGARRRSGFGRIESVKIEPDKNAHENWKMRVRPWKMRDDDVEIYAACKAPYWASENRMAAFVPQNL